jgi:hypothetical protein
MTLAPAANDSRTDGRPTLVNFITVEGYKYTGA